MLAKASCGASWKTVELWSSVIHFLEIQVSPAVNAGEPGVVMMVIMSIYSEIISSDCGCLV